MRRSRSITDRLADKFTVGDGCWEWNASMTPNGYGWFAVDGRTASRKSSVAHRVVYELLVGPIPAGLDLDHLCRNRRCVRPAHLEPATRSVNLRRGDMRTRRNAGKTQCPRGHPYDEANTYRFATAAGTGRGCRQCRNAASRRYRAKLGV